ncbi:MAG TPA: hypothetical protein VNW92_10990, partial [Polyangiaceae bacterium]|nr:hypothetical protein [Polyangiaceae bacterium]
RLRADPRAFTGRANGPQLLVGTSELAGGAARPPSIPTVALGPGETTAAEVPTVSAVPAAKGPSSRSRQRTAGATALGLLALGGVVWAAVRSHEPTPATPAPSVGLTTTQAAPAAAVQPSAVLPSAPPTASASASAAPSATASPSKAHPATVAPRPSVRHRDCNPPWVLDSKGIRRVKPQCT